MPFRSKWVGRTLHGIGVRREESEGPDRCTITSHMLSRSSDTLGDTNIFILIVSCLASPRKVCVVGSDGGVAWGVTCSESHSWDMVDMRFEPCL